MSIQRWRELGRMTAGVPAGAGALALFGVLLMAGAWASTVDRVRGERAEAISNEFSKNTNLVLALDVQINQLLKRLDQVLEVVRNQYEQPGGRIPLRSLVGLELSRSQYVTFIGVVDEHGDVLEAVQPFTATNVADRQMFRTHQASRSRSLLISPPILGRVSGRWAITLTRRIDRRDGSFGGIAAISIEPSCLTELFENSTLGPADVMSLVLLDGVTLVRRSGQQIEFGENIAKSQLLVEHARSPLGNDIGRGGVDGLLRVFSYRTMRDYPVIPTVGTSAADAFAPVERRARAYYQTVALATLFIAAGCIAGIVLLTRQERARRQLREQASLLDKAQDAITSPASTGA